MLAVLFSIGYDSVWLLLAVSAVRAFGTGVQMPTVRAFLPQLVPEDKLIKVNAINSSIQSLVTLLSPMLSGVLLTISTIETIFFIDVVTAAVAVSILFWFLQTPVHSKAFSNQTTGYFTDMREGLAFINNHEWIKPFFQFIAIFFCTSRTIILFNPLAGCT